MNRAALSSFPKLLGAMAVLAAALLYITVFDWGSPPDANRLPMRTLAAARGR